MNFCINPQSEQAINLAKELGVSSNVAAAKAAHWMNTNNTDEFPTRLDLIKANQVNYVLDAVDILSSNEATKVFDKGLKNKWTLDKILTELKIPKAQQEFIKTSGKTSQDEIVSSLLANYSYAVEINTAQHKYAYNASDPKYDADGNIIHNGSPSQHYSNMTVPGGTNYTENEIAVPNIVPSIKGHAQFSTDNGIGWFRSDDKGLAGVSRIMTVYDKGYLTPEERLEALDLGESDESIAENIQTAKNKPTAPVIIPAPELKTRRILEVQSDWAQKIRKSSDPDLHVAFNFEEIVRDLQDNGDLKIIC